MKITAFAASNSTQSINKQLVSYVAGLIPDAQVKILDLNDYELPLFSVEREQELGQLEKATQFLAELANADALIISFAEHNGMYTAAYKNLFDWCSRQAKSNIYAGKAMLLLATSPGGRGAKTVLAHATEASPRFGGDVRASVSVPSFNDNFDTDAGRIVNPEINQQLHEAIAALMAFVV